MLFHQFLAGRTSVFSLIAQPIHKCPTSSKIAIVTHPQVVVILRSLRLCLVSGSAPEKWHSYLWTISIGVKETKLRFKASLNGNGNVADYLRTLILKDPPRKRSPFDRYCFSCHEDTVFAPVNVEDTSVVHVDGVKYVMSVEDYPMDQCSQCGETYMSVSLGAAFDEVLVDMISEKNAEGSPIPERLSFQEWLFEDQMHRDLGKDIMILNRSKIAKLILSFGELMDVAESKDEQISILAKMELLNQLIHSEGGI